MRKISNDRATLSTPKGTEHPSSKFAYICLAVVKNVSVMLLYHVKELQNVVIETLKEEQSALNRTQTSAEGSKNDA